MAAIASGWNVILRKQTLEENNYNLRKVSNYPRHRPVQDRVGGSRTKSG